MQLFQEAGIFGIPLLVLTLVILGLALRGLAAPRRHAAGARTSLLYWGGVAAVLGVLGQCSGLYNALKVIAGAEAISPARVSQGFAESFSTSLWGFGLLLAALLLAAMLQGLGGRGEPQP